MQERLLLVGQFLVNGTKSEVTVDNDCISWRPLTKSSKVLDAQATATVSSISSNRETLATSQQFSIATGSSIDSVVGSNNKIKNKHDNHIKRIEFSKVIGIRRWKPPAQQQQQQQKRQSYKTSSIDAKRHSRIKVYYSKQNATNKSTVAVAQFHPLRRLKRLPKQQNLIETETQLDFEVETRAKLQISSSSLSLNSSSFPQLEPQPFQLQLKSPTIDELAQRIEESFELKRELRPKRLLIFVNPFGGKGKALHLYKSQVRRLFELAGIDTELVVTNYANHARDTIEDPLFNIEYFDGVVCVGGDGMFSELMNGLLFRYNRDKILAAQLKFGQQQQQQQQQQEQVVIGIGGAASSGDVSNGVAVGSENSSGTVSGGSSDSELSSTDHNGLAKNSNNNVLATTISTTELANNNQDIRFSENRTISEQRLIELRAALGGIGQQFVSPPIPVGVIGAGSTDANSFGFIGTNDVITATLNIILGNQIRIDVCSVHSIREDRLLRFVSTFVAYGYFGDVIRESEKLRWLGPSRYDVTGVNNLIKNRTYKGLVKILTASLDGTPLNKLERCHSKCEHCSVSGDLTKGQQQQQQKDSEFRFIEIQGSFVGVNAAVTACRCLKTKKGFSPSNHLANGCADLILVRPCTRMQYIHYLLRTGWSKKSAFDLKYVEAYRCRQFEFIAQNQQEGSATESLSAPSWATSSSASSVDHGSNSNSLDSKQSDRLSGSLGSTLSSWNMDGEILNEQSIRVKVNNQLMRVFGTGEPTTTH